MSDERTNEQLIADWKNGDEKAFDVLWNKNIGLRNKARHESFRHTPFDDAMSHISIAFWKAARKFDHSRGLLFSTLFMHYAKFQARTEWHRKKAVRRGGSVSHISIDIHDKDLDGWKQFTKHEESAIDKEKRAEDVREAERRMERLPSRFRQVARMRFDGLSLQEIGFVLGITRERVRQVEVDAMRWLAMSDEEFEEEKTYRVLLGASQKQACARRFQKSSQ